MLPLDTAPAVRKLREPPVVVALQHDEAGVARAGGDVERPAVARERQRLHPFEPAQRAAPPRPGAEAGAYDEPARARAAVDRDAARPTGADRHVGARPIGREHPRVVEPGAGAA